MNLLKTGDIQNRDPFVLKENRNYYLFGSTDRDIWKGPGTGFDAYVGHDLEYWEGPYPAFRPDAGFWGRIISGRPKCTNTGAPGICSPPSGVKT